MSANCGACNQPCASVDSDQTVKCSGACEKHFHARCVKDDLVGKKTRSGRDWKCKDCRNASSANSSVNSSINTSVTKDFIIRVLEEFKQEMFGELKTFKNDMTDLSAAVKFVSDKLDESTQLIKEVKSELSLVKRENEDLRRKNASLTSDVNALKDKVRTLEQYSRKNNIEISGLPVTKDEDAFDLVKDVGISLGVEVLKNEISAAHRIPSFQSGRTPALVVQFVNRTVRDTFLKKYREKKGGISAHDVNSAFSMQRMYINEHLTPENKVFFAKIKSKAKEIGYSFVWCRDCKFFVRKTQGEKCVRIDSYDDLEKLK